MKQILVALIAICALAVFFFGGSIPKSYTQLKTGSYEIKLRPMINIGDLFGNFGK